MMEKGLGLRPIPCKRAKALIATEEVCELDLIDRVALFEHCVQCDECREQQLKYLNRELAEFDAYLAARRKKELFRPK